MNDLCWYTSDTYTGKQTIYDTFEEAQRSGHPNIFRGSREKVLKHERYIELWFKHYKDEHATEAIKECAALQAEHLDQVVLCGWHTFFKEWKLITHATTDAYLSQMQYVFTAEASK